MKYENFTQCPKCVINSMVYNWCLVYMYTSSSATAYLKDYNTPPVVCNAVELITDNLCIQTSLRYCADKHNEVGAIDA